MKPQLITAANGYIPVDLHVAQFASTYFPADFLHRLNIATGRPSRFITGVDVKGRYAQRSFLQENFADAVEANEFYKNKFEAILTRYRVEPTYVHTDHPDVQIFRKKTINNLIAANAAYLGPSQSFYCNNCDEHLSKSEVSSPSGNLKSDVEIDIDECSCNLCQQKNLKVFEDTQYFLDLPREESVKVRLQERAAKTLGKMIDGVWLNDFKAWEFSRNKSYYGSPFPGDPSKNVYLWYESLVSKFIGTGDGNASAHDIEGVSIKSFFGKGIVQYYTLVFPQIIRKGFGVENFDLTLCGHGFCDLKKSTSDMLDIQTADKKYNVDDLRFYCAYIVNDDVKDFVMTDDAMKHFVDTVLNGAILNYITKAQTLLLSHGVDLQKTEVPEKLIKPIHEILDAGTPRKVLLKIEEMARDGLKRINKKEFNANDPQEAAQFLTVSRLMHAYTPNRISEMVPGIEKITLYGNQFTAVSSKDNVFASQSISASTP